MDEACSVDEKIKLRSPEAVEGESGGFQHQARRQCRVGKNRLSFDFVNYTETFKVCLFQLFKQSKILPFVQDVYRQFYTEALRVG